MVPELNLAQNASKWLPYPRWLPKISTSKNVCAEVDKKITIDKISY